MHSFVCAFAVVVYKRRRTTIQQRPPRDAEPASSCAKQSQNPREARAQSGRTRRRAAGMLRVEMQFCFTLTEICSMLTQICFMSTDIMAQPLRSTCVTRMDEWESYIGTQMAQAINRRGKEEGGQPAEAHVRLILNPHLLSLRRILSHCCSTRTPRSRVCA